jgi:Spy/CpxP family protein refolding chaperone
MLLFIGVVVIPSPAAAERFKWWESPEVQSALSLSPKQVAALERIFDTSLPERRALLTALDKSEFELEQLLKEANPDERVAAELIDRLEEARARRNVARSMLLFRMRRVLTPAQRTALDRIAVQRRQ